MNLYKFEKWDVMELIYNIYKKYDCKTSEELEVISDVIGYFIEFLHKNEAHDENV